MKTIINDIKDIIDEFKQHTTIKDWIISFIIAIAIYVYVLFIY